jgi:MYXO-CTERM domain-containing protein
VVTETTAISGTSWTVAIDLTEDTSYAWDARSVDPDGLSSDWTTPQGFFVDTTNAAPADVVWVAPLAGDQLEGLSPVLEVSVSSDAESDDLTYTFEIDTATTFSSADFDTTDSSDPSWDLDADSVALTENTTWYLRARVVDARGAASGWATIEVFARGENDAPAAPVLMAPVDGTSQLTTDSAPTFVVAHAEDPDGDDVFYDILLARDEALTDLVDEVQGLTPGAGTEGTADQTSWTPAESLASGDYYWSAAAVDADGASTDADEVWAFTVEEPSVGDDDDSGGDDDTGCDCQSSIATGAPTSLWLLLLLVPAMRRRR